MKNSTIKFIAIVSIMLLTANAQASEANIINITNPTQGNGVQVGDVLNRTLTIEVDAPYQLAKNALPMKSELRNGIELAEITVKTSEKNHKNSYHIALRYQVFASAAKPTVMQLPEESFTFTDGAKALSTQLPAWHFWFAPLVSEGITNAKDNLQPQYKPTLINVSGHYTRLWLALAALMAGLLGLVYINADKRWLPFMNGAFASAHRQLKKLPKTEASHKQALVLMHEAFNRIHGENLFASDVERFVSTHTAFAKFKTDITNFFTQSNASLFDSQAQNSTQFMQVLIVLSKRLRDCERGV
ncbi:MAG: nonribosomal peptide synthetase MxaA [Methylotenera sp.]|nr:nonribosomal peptide synthetase MxaA [Methylotenera sp.]